MNKRLLFLLPLISAGSLFAQIITKNPSETVTATKTLKKEIGTLNFIAMGDWAEMVPDRKSVV